MMCKFAWATWYPTVTVVVTANANTCELGDTANVALRAARAGVRAAQQARVTATTGISVKADHTRVSVADYAAQAAIIRELPPDARVIGEESSTNAPSATLRAAARVIDVSVTELTQLLNRQPRNGRHELWFVDPTDGTEGYLRGKSWAVGVAMRKGPAALALPARGVILVGDVQQSRAWVVHDVDGRVDALTPRVPSLNRVRWHFSPASTKVAVVGGLPPPERLCCGSLVKYGEVALGASHALIQIPPLGFVYAWDHVAGVALVRASSGTVTDLDGNSVQFDGGTDTVATKAFVVTAFGVDHERWLDYAKQIISQM